VTASGWEPWEAGLRYRVRADRFLHHMVRFLVGTMVDIGLGRRPLDDMNRLLAATDNQATSPPAPPEGLYFVAAEYAAEWFVDGRTGDRTAEPPNRSDRLEPSDRRGARA
jgi:tRNA pseudouridine38-40 synthase